MNGSVLRGDFGKNSGVDVLAKFEMGHAPGFLGLFEKGGRSGGIIKYNY